MVNEAREAIGAADRDMKNLRTEFRSEIDQRLKASGQGYRAPTHDRADPDRSSGLHAATFHSLAP